MVAVGGDLDPDRVLLGYTVGIFPWYSEGQPILWHSPDPRFVLYPEDLVVGRSLRNRMRRRTYRITMDQAFEDVIEGCARAARPGQPGTWITTDMERCYVRLYERGFAHSVEAWDPEGRLVGGLYGVSLGAVFFGESMFARAPDASKVALVALVGQLRRWGFQLLDSQVHTDHLERFGAIEIPRSAYLEQLREALREPARRGLWTFDEQGPYAGWDATGPGPRRGEEDAP